MKSQKRWSFLSVVLALAVILVACTSSPESSSSAEESKSVSDSNEAIGETGDWDLETDFLIIGGGIAGQSAAIEAADQGFEKILVLEKLAITGGSAFVSEGILGGYETQVTKALDLHVDPEEIYYEQMYEKKYNIDPELTRLTIEKSGETIDWLIDTIGVDFEPEVGKKDGYGTLDTIHLVEGGGPGLRAPFDDAIKSRPSIEIMTETQGLELITEDGNVIGAVAKQGEDLLRIKADAVLIATGGYSTNHDIITMGRPANNIFQTSMMAGSTGDGLVMSTKVGVATQNLDQIQCYLRDYMNPTSQLPYMFNIFVGRNGQRFMDEKRTGQTWNQENRDDVIMQLGQDNMEYFYALSDHATMEKFGAADSAEEHDGMIVADTLEALANEMGISPEGLTESVNHWNSMVESGEDSDFGRTNMLVPIGEGPYYALKTIFFSSVCHGGLVKNEKSEALQFDGTSVPGLYLAGEVTSVTNSNGYTISNAVTFGRIAAQNAYAYVN